MRRIPRCNISMHTCEYILQDGEHICHRCKGRGAFFMEADPKSRRYYIYPCPICHGDGKIDWITKISGNPVRLPRGVGTSPHHIAMKCPRDKHCKTMKRMYKKQKWNEEFEKFKKERS